MKEKKEKKKSGILYKIVMTILICIIIFSGVKLGKIFYEYYKGSKVYDGIADLAGVADGMDVKINWEALEKENPDIVAWLYCKDTVINYPVVQGTDNTFYLNRMFNKDWNVKGTLFVDYRDEAPFENFNTVIYGHRMKDGSMFKCLGEYRDTEGYYKKHKKMKLYTKEKQYELQLFGAATIPSDSDMYNMWLTEDGEKQEYINWILENNEIPGYDGSVQVSSSDKLVMLSTCTYEFENARLCVWGKLVEKE